MTHKDNVYLLVNDNKIAFTNENNNYILFNGNTFHEAMSLKSYPVMSKDNMDYFVTEVEASFPLPFNAEWVPLRTAFTLLNEKYIIPISKAFHITHWHKHHQFCGGCGAKTIHKYNTWEMQCSVCETLFYPQISPAVIVLIKKNNELLMARGPHFPVGVYGLIAGFVEPGENIEDAIHREVLEEIGIKVKNLRYYDSQSWPFPNSLMLAFIADYASGEINIDQTEIESAGWYKAENIPGITTQAFSVSIAYKMIQAFIANQV